MKPQNQRKPPGCRFPTPREASPSWEATEREARRTFGPRVEIRFAKAFPAAIRYQIGQFFIEDGRRMFGVVGQGCNWRAALEDARARKAQVEAAPPQLEEESKVGNS